MLYDLRKTYEPEQGAAFTKKVKLRKWKITIYEEENKISEKS